MADLSLDEITARVVDAVLNERYINAGALTQLIRPILSVWVKKADGYKKTGVASTDKLLYSNERNLREKQFWVNQLRGVVGEEKMQPYYDKAKAHLLELGIYEFKP